MKSSKPADRAKIARLRAAGLTVREIARATGISYQRASQILATEPVPVWNQAEVWVEGDVVHARADTDPRILHALITNAITRQGKLVAHKNEGA